MNGDKYYVEKKWDVVQRLSQLNAEQSLTFRVYENYEKFQNNVL